MFDSIEEAIEDIRQGRMVIVVDDEDRENEGDLVMAAEKVTGQAINFMASHAKGLVCMPMEADRLKELGLGQMVKNNTDPHETAFTISIDHIDTSTGISAFERAHTVLKALDKDTRPEDFKRPGHIFPLRAKENGVLERLGHTEASVDLARLAGLYPAAVICEIMKDDGTMARLDDLVEYKKKHNLKLIKIDDLVAYRKKNEKLIERVGQAKLPTDYGDFNILGYQSSLDPKEEHIALVKGEPKDGCLVRVHSECLTGDGLFSKKCDCGEQLAKSIALIEEKGEGIIIYLRQEGRGIGILNKIRAYHLQDQGLDTIEANEKLGFPSDMRDYLMAYQILRDLGISSISLITNNPEKIQALEDLGVEVKERVGLESSINPANEDYIRTKQEKMKHLINL